MASIDTQEPDRFPIGDIPSDLICRLCEGGAGGPFKNQLAFRSHMNGKHHIKYELRLTQVERNALLKLKDNPPPQEPQELKAWHRLAIVKHEIYGDSWEAIAEEHGKGGDTLRKIAQTPAGIKCVEEIREITSIKGLTKMLLENAQLNMYEDWLVALDWAKQARDYKTLHSMLKDVGLQPTLEETKRDERPQTIMITLGSADLQPVATLSSYVIVDDAEEPDGNSN